MNTVVHLTTQELEAGLDHVMGSPKDDGKLELIVARPKQNERIVLESAELDEVRGLIGDNWETRQTTSTKDGSPHPEKQITIMNSRAIKLISPDSTRWPLAGDQLYVDIDLSDENLPTGSKLLVGNAIIEITAPPHNGCKSFVERFGLDAMKFVNSEIGKKYHLRGVYAKVVQSGTVTTGEIIRKV